MGSDYDYTETAHQVIWDNIHGGTGTGGTHDAADAWYQIHNQLLTVEAYVQSATQRIEQTQTGAAADAATAASAPLVSWTGEAKMIALGLSRRVTEQGDAFQHYRDTIPEPVPVVDSPLRDGDGTWNVGEWSADTFIDWWPGNQTAEEEQSVRAAQAEDEARRQMGLYQGETNERLGQWEQFAQAPPVVVQAAEPSMTQPRVDGYGGGTPGATSGGGIAAATGGQATGGGGYGGTPGLRPGVPIAPGESGPVGTPPMGSGPGTRPGGSPVAPGAQPGRPGTPGGLGPDGARPTPGGVPGTGGARPTPGGAPGARAPGTVGGVGSRGPLGGGPGSGGPGLGGPGFVGRGGTAGGFGPGGQTGTGPGGSSGTNTTATTGQVGRAGAPGNPGAGPVGGGARRDDDHERTRPAWLVEDDENAIIGELPAAPPAVIGAPDDTDKRP